MLLLLRARSAPAIAALTFRNGRLVKAVGTEPWLTLSGGRLKLTPKGTRPCLVWQGDRLKLM